MSATDSPDTEARVQAMRPMLTQSLHVVLPQLPLIDCARVVNSALDLYVERGETDALRWMLRLFQHSLNQDASTTPTQEAS